MFIITSNMNIHKPEIIELLSLVEQKYQKNLQTSTDFDEFTFHLKQETGEQISTSTLKRLWGYVNDSHTPRQQTLDTLSRYIGHDYFRSFCSWLKSSTAYNSSFFTTKQISSKELLPGQEVEIGWAPNRYLRLQYQGNSIFLITEALQSKLQKGDSFEASVFLLEQPLYLPYILRNGNKTSPFIAGRNGGLTLINQLSHGE